MKRTLATLVAGAAALVGLAGPAAAHDLPPYSTPGNSIELVGQPKYVAPNAPFPGGVLVAGADLQFRYRCEGGGLVQISARARDEDAPFGEDLANNNARGGFSFANAVCDGKQHVQVVRVAAFAPAIGQGGTNIERKSRVTVSFDLARNTVINPETNQRTFLAGARLHGLLLVGGGNPKV